MKDSENKLLILYFIERMDLPLSRSQISDFLTGSNMVSYMMLQEYLADLDKEGYLESTQDDNNTRYTLTGDGAQMLEYFEKHISPENRSRINQYVKDNRKNIQRDFETTATFFPNADNTEFTVKCGVYDEGRVLMEVAISLDTREQARLIQNNWKTGAKVLYGEILKVMATHDSQ